MRARLAELEDEKKKMEAHTVCQDCKGSNRILLWQKYKAWFDILLLAYRQKQRKSFRLNLSNQ